jgi:hypothetical protein
MTEEYATSVFSIDSGGSNLLRNIGATLLNYAESHFRRPKFWSFLSLEFHIAHSLAGFQGFSWVHCSVQPVYWITTQYASLQSVLNRKPTVVTRLRAWRSGFRIPSGAKDFSLLQSLQNGFGANSATYFVGTAVFFPGVKRPEFEAEHSLSGVDVYPIQ